MITMSNTQTTCVKPYNSIQIISIRLEYLNLFSYEQIISVR